MHSALIEYLEQFVTDERRELFDRILENRTNYITLVLEDIFQPQNASAVLRTCDCFGIQTINIIENRNEYQLNPDVTLGSDKWITLNRYNHKGNNTISTISRLRNEGYRIVATTPHTNDVELENFDVSKGKFALLFGTELNGLSETAIEMADEYLKIPMRGFTESFNISVSAAIILHHLSDKIRKSDVNWQLEVSEKDELKLDWLRKTIKQCDLIEKDYFENRINKQNNAN